MIILYYIFAALLIWLSYKSFRGGIDYLNYFKQELKKPLADHTPFATIFAPCRGVDQGMLENLDALLAQDYPEFEVVFIVDEEGDGATKLIEQAWQEARRPVKLVVAPKATDSSQKVTNLREVIQYVDESSEVFVFVDSDARPSKQWLKNLIAPLIDPQIGATTGYRWFISKHETLASEMRNMWNASIASHQGSNKKTNFCWGGACAIKRSTFDQLDVHEKWHGTVSDDFTLTHAVHEAGLDIHFVPGALTASVEDCSWHELFEFTTRQMKITRVYSSKLWVMSFIGSGLFTATMVASLMIIILSPKNNWTVAAALFTLTAVTIFSIGKSLLRMNAVQLALPDYANKLRRQTLPQLTLWSLTPFVFLFNCVAASVSRRIEWRGTLYEMISSSETKVINKITR